MGEILGRNIIHAHCVREAKGLIEFDQSRSLLRPEVETTFLFLLATLILNTTRRTVEALLKECKFGSSSPKKTNKH